MARTLKRRIPVDAITEVRSVWTVPRGYKARRGDAVILAHGAGSDMDSPFMRHVHAGLAARGLLAVRFNFPYIEAERRRPPDPAPRLEATFRAVVARLLDDKTLRPRRLVIGGKSLGGRIASHLAAAGEPVDGLLLLGYPLHPPGRTDRLRDAHLPSVPCPMLFLQGGRDPLCDLSLLKSVLWRVSAPSTLRVVAEGDHSFHVPKLSRYDDRQVLDAAVEIAAAWIDGLPVRA
jgi:predicted alpha/beta-hydrolase family hydrolase